MTGDLSFADDIFVTDAERSSCEPVEIGENHAIFVNSAGRILAVVENDVVDVPPAQMELLAWATSPQKLDLNYILCCFTQLLTLKFRVVTNPVAHNVSIPFLTANTLASPIETDFPVDTARPRAVNESPLAGAIIFVVKSMVENAPLGGSFVPTAQHAAMSINIPIGPA